MHTFQEGKAKTKLKRKKKVQHIIGVMQIFIKFNLIMTLGLRNSEDICTVEMISTS